MKPGDSLDRITGSVSDGNPVDWSHAEPTDELDTDTLNALHHVARIAEFHRSLQRVPADAPTLAQSSGRSSAEASPPALAQTLWAPDRAAPERWGDLLVLEPIGAGARGEVWRAWDPTLQRQVALKFLQVTGGEGSATGRTDLLNEARSLARVRHIGVVSVYGIAEHEGRAGMWMECLEGVTLAREIDRLGALPPRKIIDIGLQLCSALEALEAAGLVHRDIKPSNIVLESEDRAVLTDFGLGWRPALGDTDTPRSSGTPMFMAPEVLAGEAPTHQSDLYALGVTLWCALAGQPPFQAKTLDELKREIMRGPSRSLQSLCPAVSRALVQAISAAIEPSISSRPKSAADLASQIRAARSGTESPTAPPRPLLGGAVAQAARGVSSGLRRVFGALGRVALEPRSEKVASIAVLPFVNRSREAEDEYFSDGLADELLQMLAKIRGLRVAARSSAFSFKGRQATVGEIGAALRVAAVLEGTVRKVGDRVRIAVQLVRVSDGYHIWSEIYDRTLNDIFAVQDDIAQSVVKELRATLLGEKVGPEASRQVSAEVADAAKGRATNAEAHRLYLLGRHFSRRLSREDIPKGIDYLNQALALEPSFALAWAELAGALSRAAGRLIVPHGEGYARAREAALRALSIEPDLGDAHARLAWIQLFYDWDWRTAAVSFARALERPPGDVAVLNGAGVLAMALGRTEEAVALHRRATEQDPLSATAYSNFGLTLQRAGCPVEAEAALRRAIELDPQRYLTRTFLAWALLEQGRGEEALAEAGRESDPGERLFGTAIVQHHLGHEAESESALRELIEKHGEGYAFQIAEVHGARGESDAAFAWLERAYIQRDSGISELRCSAHLHSLHGDPRWGALLNKTGLADPQP